MKKEEWEEYSQSPQYREDFEEVSRLIKEDDINGLVEFLNKRSKQRAKEAAERLADSGG